MKPLNYPATYLRTGQYLQYKTVNSHADIEKLTVLKIKGGIKTITHPKQNGGSAINPILFRAQYATLPLTMRFCVCLAIAI